MLMGLLGYRLFHNLPPCFGDRCKTPILFFYGGQGWRLMELYHTKRWEKKRALILWRDKYRCQYYARLGRNVPANTVHHVFPVKEFPEYQWENWNLISLSNEAHEKMHLRNYDTLSEDGIDLLKRIARKYKVPIPLRYK